MSEPILEVDTHGTKRWWLNGLLHRVDGPAVEWSDGGVEWCQDDKLHRVDGPAIEYVNGDVEWWVDGKLHRVGGPAVEHTSGHREWWVDGKRHRVDGPAIEYANGGKAWWFDGSVRWFFNGWRFDGVGFLLDVFVGEIGEVDGDWLPAVLVVDGFEFGR